MARLHHRSGAGTANPYRKSGRTSSQRSFNQNKRRHFRRFCIRLLGAASRSEYTKTSPAPVEGPPAEPIAFNGFDASNRRTAARESETVDKESAEGEAGVYVAAKMELPGGVRSERPVRLLDY